MLSRVNSERIREQAPKDSRRFLFSPLPFSKGEDEGEGLASSGSARRLLTLALSSNEKEGEANSCLTLSAARLLVLGCFLNGFPFRTGKKQYRLGVLTVEICTETDSYRALVGPGLLEKAGHLIVEKLPLLRCAIISDTKVAPLFGERVRKSLATSRVDPVLITVPPGEKSKTLRRAGLICEQMLAAGLDRQSFVIGLGGGVIGDLSGFVAAIFERGVPHVQIATTLLAMVDSSIGGKTGVNARAGKNLIGAFHHPILVIDDVEVLKTLPSREISQGFAEIIKHAIIANVEMFGQLQDVDLNKIDFALLIQRNVELKARRIA